MYKVKLTAGTGESAKIMLRQTMGREGISKCGKYQFFIDEEVDEADFWVVRNKYIKKSQSCTIAPENTILMISEPKSVVKYPQKYVNQFATFCSCQEGVKHRNVIYMPPALPWFVGIMKKAGRTIFSLDYDYLKSNPFPPKTKLISVITSNKAFTKGHQDRINFVEKLQAYYGESLDIFGRGFNDFDDKWDVLSPYKYHIALENSSSKYYWTEKISDCYLTGTYPIYFGCTNIEDYFPQEAYKTIDINDFDEAIHIINKTIKKNEFEKNIPSLERCKDLVLEDYNIFEQIVLVLDKLDPTLPKKTVILKPAKSLFDWSNFYYYFIQRNIFQLRNLIRKIIKGKSLLYKV